MKIAMKGLFFSLLLVNMAAEANALQYIEAVDGDINYSKNFTLGIGVNTISGNQTIADEVNSTPDSDEFRFYIPDGAQLTSFTFAFSNVIPNNSDIAFFQTGYEIINWSETFTPVAPYEYITVFDVYTYSVALSPVSLFINSLPLGSGSYAVQPAWSYMEFQNPGGSSLGHTIGSLDYTISMQVTAVPLPGATWLFGTGLLGSLGLKRRGYAG